MRVYTTEKLSANIERTPEGFLFARNVPIARTGVQLYHASELPAPREGKWIQDERGAVEIHRLPEDVFRAETIDSFNGKSIVDNHPDDVNGVNPANWQELSVGVVLDPRRGKGDQSEVLLADLLITHKDAIEAVLAGKREVSCGYDCQYAIAEDGRGFQQNIIGNHVALVEKGRCGARCAIGDRQGAEMKLIDKLRGLVGPDKLSQLDAMVRDAPADALAALSRDEATNGSGVHIHMGAQPAMNDARKYSDAALDEQFGKIEKKFEEGGKASDERHKAVMDAIANLTPKEETKENDEAVEGELKAEAPPGTGDQAVKATDSMFLADSFQDTVALAEIIAPGIALPTFDRAAKPRDSFKSICALRKKAIGLGNNDPATNAIILSVRGGKELTQDTLEKMPCGEARSLFLAAGAMKKASNAVASVRDLRVPTGVDPVKVTVVASPADLNKKNREFYANAR